MKPLVANRKFKPDFKVSYQLKQGVEFGLSIVEVKPAAVEYTPNKSDFIKINLELKCMLDELIRYNVKDPVVFGLLVRGFECSLFRMTLEHDGFYFSPIVQTFHLPGAISDISLVPQVTCIFLTIKDEVDGMIRNIQQRNKSVSPLTRYMRPSFDMPHIIAEYLVIIYLTNKFLCFLHLTIFL